MATLDDILTTQKNGVVAVNNLSQSLNAFYDAYLYIAGQNTSGSLTQTPIVTSAYGSGRFVSYTTTISGGSSTGSVYDSFTYSTVSISGNGSTATISYSGSTAFSIGDRIAVYDVVPSGYNTTSAVITGVDATNNTISYSNATTAPVTTPGVVFKIYDASLAKNLLISSLSGTLGTYAVGVNFSNGLVVVPASGQYVSITYSVS